jgi:D-glycero-D-manno-heptose 1,7-bisphosphate phosphatase
MNKALFLDRDGVINEDYGYVHKIEEFHFRDGIFDVCRAAQNARMKIIVVTNQAGIGRGLYGEADYQVITRHMLDSLAIRNVYVDSVYHCPFHPTHGLGHYKASSFDRKPFSGMFIKACADHHINPFFSIMIGDNESDRMAAYGVGIRYYLDAKSLSWSDSAIRLIRSM